MQLRKTRQILKAFADDSRLRIINLLKSEELTVTELYRVLDKNQSNLSKHLTRLRLTGIVGDRRKGNNVYYYLIKAREKGYKELLNSITVGFSDLEIFKRDLKRLMRFRKRLEKNNMVEQKK